MSSCSSNPRIKHNRINGVTLCDCGFLINPRTSWTQKNPGRRFLSCPILEERKKCRLYRFLDEEFPSQYYKDLVIQLHNDLEGMKLNCNSELVEEHQNSRIEGLKVMEDLRMTKSKLQVYERLFMLMLGLVIVLCVVVGALSM